MKRFIFNNTTKLAIITFFSSLYLYGHVGTLYLQARGLSLLQASSIWSIIVATIFLAEVPTGIAVTSEIALSISDEVYQNLI